MKVAFLCKGSRGDVEPIIALALTLRKRQSAAEVILVCCSSAVKGLENALAKEQEWLKLNFLPEPTEIFRSQEQQKSDVSRQTLLNKEVACSVEACSNGVDAVVFNLFTLEGYFIAMHFKVPSVAVSPFLITKPPPQIFEKRFSQEHPFLYNELKKHAKGCVSYKEVDHWMWRLFLDDISTACDTAGIPSFPLPYPHPSSSPPPTAWSLPPPTQLLYGISSTLVHREQFWPESVHLCGFWKLPDDWCIEQVDPNVRAYVDAHTDRLVYTGFGSMETYINDIDWNELLLTLSKVFEELELFSIVQCIADGPMMNAVNGKSYSHLYLCPVYVSHSWLFPKCVTVIHHGGAGTVSSAVVAGVPQIICPVMFDQAHWGHIVEWKGLGKLINTGPSGLTCDQLHSAMSSVMKDSTIMTCIKDIKDAMVGTDTVVTIIEDISI